MCLYGSTKDGLDARRYCNFQCVLFNVQPMNRRSHLATKDVVQYEKITFEITETHTIGEVYCAPHDAMQNAEPCVMPSKKCTFQKWSMDYPTIVLSQLETYQDIVSRDIEQLFQGIENIVEEYAKGVRQILIKILGTLSARNLERCRQINMYAYAAHHALSVQRSIFVHICDLLMERVHPILRTAGVVGNAVHISWVQQALLEVKEDERQLVKAVKQAHMARQAAIAVHHIYKRLRSSES